jgi:sortase A
VGCLGVYGGWFVYSEFHQIELNWSFDEALQAERAPGIAPKPRQRHDKPAALTAIGRISVPRLNLKAIVEEGTDDATLLRAVGHVSGTALPGDPGNFAIAGHRDSFLRALKDVQRNDEIDVETLQGSYRYVVDELSIVDPGNTSVLQPTREKTLTIVTCFPFRYIGPAPRRFIVRARQIGELSTSSPGARKSVALRVGSSRPR